MKHLVGLLFLATLFSASGFAGISDSVSVSEYGEGLIIGSSPYSVPKGKLLLETTFSYHQIYRDEWGRALHQDFPSNNTKNEIWKLPELSIRYGINKWLEVGLGAALAHQKTTIYPGWYGAPEEIHNETFLQKLQVSTKATILKQKKWYPHLSFQMMFTSSRLWNSYRGFYYTYTTFIRLPASINWGYKIKKRWRLNGAFIYNFIRAQGFQNHYNSNHFSTTLNGSVDVFRGLGLCTGIGLYKAKKRWASDHPFKGIYPVNAGIYYRFKKNIQVSVLWQGRAYNHETGRYVDDNTIMSTFSWAIF